jgi:CspA family cold shock protein
MAQGIVKWFSAEQGYGFIEPDGSEDQSDVFVHLTAVERSGYETLEQGQKVLYKLEENELRNRKSIFSVEILEP